MGVVMWYPHEEREKTTRYTGPRPKLPTESPSLRAAMRSYLEHRELSYQVAIGNGWYPAQCHGAARIVIPCPTSQNEPYYQARAMGAHEVRYASPRASRGDAVVLCYPLVIRKSARLFVVEGPMDALAAATCDHYGVGLMGNTPPQEVLCRVKVIAKTIGFDQIYVVPDMDAMGMGAVISMYMGQHGIKTKVLYPEGKDLAAMHIVERRDFLRG